MKRILSSSLTARVAVAVLAVIAVLGVFGPLLAPHDPLAQDTTAILGAPSLDHWLGTDALGRDTLSRLLAGSPLSLAAALSAVVVGLVLGVIPGLASVFLGRVFEWTTMRVTDALIALPFLVFAIAMTALWGNGVYQAMVAVGVLIAPTFYRVSRAAAVDVASAPYVQAAVLAGASTIWVLRRHVWRHVAPPVAIVAASMTGVSLVIVASLTFLGVGVVPPTPTWGGLLATDLQYLHQQPWAPFAPALLITVTVWAVNALADALRDVETVRRAADQPSTDQHSTDQHSTDQPSTDQPSTDQPNTADATEEVLA